MSCRTWSIDASRQWMKFGTEFARRGLIVESGLAARIFDTREAVRMNLVNQVFAEPEFMDRVTPMRRVYRAMLQTLGHALYTASKEMGASLQCEDFKEGVAHFVGRAPALQVNSSIRQTRDRRQSGGRRQSSRPTKATIGRRRFWLAA